MSMSEQIANHLVTVTENQQKVYNAGYEKGKAESGSDEFIGVKYSDFETTGYKLPRTADARSLDKMMPDVTPPNGITNAFLTMVNLFSNDTANTNGGLNAALTTVYVPSKVTRLVATFRNCSKLTTIIVDFSKVVEMSQSFYACKSLTELPYMPNLNVLSVLSFYGCTGLTSVTFHKILTTWASNAFQGCTNIETINLVDGWNTAVYAHHCPNLSQASLHDMIEKLADMTGQPAVVMNVGSTNLEKIDEEHKAMATNKNWTLA